MASENAEDIAAIRKRLRKVALFPWRHLHQRLRGPGTPVINEVQDVRGDPVVVWGGFDGTGRKAGENRDHARFIANAPEDMSVLLEVLDAHEATIASLRAEVASILRTNKAAALAEAHVRSALDHTVNRAEAAESQVRAMQAVASEQAEDPGLWFIAETAAEAYLQDALRRLHAAIEGKSPEECARAALSALPETPETCPARLRPCLPDSGE